MKTLMTLLAVGVALPTWAQAQGISAVAPLTAPRGTSITLTGTLPVDTAFYLPSERPVLLAGEPYDCVKEPPKAFTRLVSLVSTLPTTENKNITTFTALVPAWLPIGEYTLCASYTPSGAGAAQWYTVPIFGGSGRLQVIEAPGGAPLEVTGVPRVVYEDNGRYRFSVLGNGFSRAGIDNEVLFDGRRVPMCWDNDQTCRSDTALGRAIVRGTHQLDIDLPVSFKETFDGSKKVQVRVRDAESSRDNAPSITLAQISPDGPHWYAALFVGALVGIVILLLAKNRSAHTIDGVPVSKLSSLLLDKNTDTYSLSRAQFYLWTGVAIYGYVYLTIAWTLLQGRLEFAPVPQNLPGIIAASAGTGIIVEGIASSKPKGAGSVRPSLADFISTGGMVVPERLQFLVWTLLGVATFVLLILASDPAVVATLPAIPTEFLTLMGISSAGYLGGRLVRKGGPVVDDIVAKASSLTLELHGRYLSKNASFQVDGEDVKADQIKAGTDGERGPEVIASDEQAQDPTMAKVLKVSIATPKANWMTRKTNPADPKRKHMLTIINPDGQKADWPFSLSGPTAIISAKDGSRTLEGPKLTVTAGNQITFDASGSKVEKGPLMFTWTRDGAPVGVTPQYTVSFAKGGPYTVKLQVTDSEQAVDTAEVRIEAT